MKGMLCYLWQFVRYAVGGAYLPTTTENDLAEFVAVQIAPMPLPVVLASSVTRCNIT